MHPLIPHFGPVVFDLPLAGGSVRIGGFGLLLVIAFLVGYAMELYKARRDGLDPVVFTRLLAWLVPGVFIGGHLGFLLFYHPERFLADPVAALNPFSGLASFGGFFFCALLAVLFFRRNRLPYLPYADAITFGVTCGWVFARLGCFTVHDHPGIETRFWLGVEGICPSGDPLTACHDLGGYEFLFALVLAAVLLWTDRRPRFPGFVQAVVFTSYGLFRFLLDFLRHPELDPRYLGLTPAQYGAVLLFAVGVWFWYRHRHAEPWRTRVARAADAGGA